MTNLNIKNLVKIYDEDKIIHDINFEVESGEFIVLVGPSGCGKSTILRMIAGLEEVTAGNIYIGDDDVTHKAASKRGIAMVFQSYALYPHMTVRENLSFGLKNMNYSKKHIEEHVLQAADILQLTDYLDRLPSHLSGGQRQRVAIGRTIVRDPKIFLFDEPLSNLDTELRVQMRHELRKLHQKLGSTMIYVTWRKIVKTCYGDPTGHSQIQTLAFFHGAIGEPVRETDDGRNIRLFGQQMPHRLCGPFAVVGGFPDQNAVQVNVRIADGIPAALHPLGDHIVIGFQIPVEGE